MISLCGKKSFSLQCQEESKCTGLAQSSPAPPTLLPSACPIMFFHNSTFRPTHYKTLRLNCFFGSSFPYEDPVSHATYIRYICMFFFSLVNMSSVSPIYWAPHRERKIDGGKGISFPTMEQGMYIIIGISVCYTSVDIIKME